MRSTTQVVPLIEWPFALRIAAQYVHVYRSEGFEGATQYLDRITGGDYRLRDMIIPIIVELGEKK